MHNLSGGINSIPIPFRLKWFQIKFKSITNSINLVILITKKSWESNQIEKKIKQIERNS